MRSRAPFVALVVVAYFAELGLAWRLESAPLLLLSGLIAPLVLGAVIGRWWASAVPLVLLATLATLLVFSPPEPADASRSFLAAVIVAGAAFQSALVAGGVFLRRVLVRRSRGGETPASGPPSRLRRVLGLILSAGAALAVLLLVLALLSPFLPASLGVLSARNWRRPVPADNRPLPVIGGQSKASRIEPRFGRVASTLASRTVEVRCWSQDDWKYRPRLAGYYSPENRTIHLSPAVCSELAALAYAERPSGTSDDTLDLARSLQALAHESAHAAGYSREAVAECYGMQAISWVAQQLGASPSDGQRLASLYWRERYPRIPDADYRSTDCRSGGPLDLHPETSAWP